METEKAPSTDDIQALQQILTIMVPLEDKQRKRIMSSISTFFGGGADHPQQSASYPMPSAIGEKSGTYGKFSNHPEISAKEFVLQKEPKTDIEKVACLAYYLTHYRATPHFKTFDISKMNAEAAQLKFSNAADAVENAAKRGFLIPSAKGNKQLSAIGEMYVRELPDREAASEVLQKHAPKRGTRSRRTSESADGERTTTDSR